jgi:hypothetical protein
MSAVGDWLREVIDVVWPLSAGAGGFLMLAAYAVRKVRPDEGQEAYKYMRAAAVAFLLSFILLWLKWRRFI